MTEKDRSQVNGTVRQAFSVSPNGMVGREATIEPDCGTKGLVKLTRLSCPQTVVMINDGSARRTEALTQPSAHRGSLAVRPPGQMTGGAVAAVVVPPGKMVSGVEVQVEAQADLPGCARTGKALRVEAMDGHQRRSVQSTGQRNSQHRRRLAQRRRGNPDATGARTSEEGSRIKAEIGAEVLPRLRAVGVVKASDPVNASNPSVPH